MKCSVVRNRLLGQDTPTAVPEKFREHLESCSACRTWLARFEQVDGAIRRLPVPRDSGKGKLALLEKIRQPQKLEPISPAKPSWSFSTLVEKYWHGSLIAATLLIGTIAFFNVGSRPPELAAMPPDPLLQDLVEVNLELVEADSPSQRLSKLSRMAEKLQTEMREIANVDATGENLNKLTTLHHRVVIEGIVDYAREIPLTQWNEILVPMRDRLAEVSKKLDEFTRFVQPNAIEPIRNMAFDAREASQRINLILKGRTS
jgi:hypothetical protein